MKLAYKRVINAKLTNIFLTSKHSKNYQKYKTLKIKYLHFLTFLKIPLQGYQKVLCIELACPIRARLLKIF
jgi:hypothetical protein